MGPGLFQHIDGNRRKSTLLVFAAIALLGAAGATLGWAVGDAPWLGLGVASAVAVVLALVAWSQGSAIVLATAGAKEVRKADDPVLVNVVEEMAIASGLPRPRIYSLDDPAMNAFAAGIAPDRAAVAVTRGLRERLRRDELQGVVAHEMAHIGNYDTRLMILLAVIVGTVALVCDGFLRSFRVARSSRGRGGVAALLIALLFALLAPLAATLIQFAVSRRREYLADATAAAMTRNPNALADALETLAGGERRLGSANRGTQHLYIVNPFRPRQQLRNPFATHPPLADRIARLRRLAGHYAPPRKDA